MAAKEKKRLRCRIGIHKDFYTGQTRIRISGGNVYSDDVCEYDEYFQREVRCSECERTYWETQKHVHHVSSGSRWKIDWLLEKDKHTIDYRGSNDE